VTIKERAYLGVNTTVLCGVTIGPRAIVGAGSLVNQDIPAETVAFGCPATVRGSLADFQQRFQEAMTDCRRQKYWDIIPQRERQRTMSEQEYEGLRRDFLRRFGAPGVE
jgi:carbonic anhydrase/acetyltransferase-like protein (isoleucine patch superfamily)